MADWLHPKSIGMEAIGVGDAVSGSPSLSSPKDVGGMPEAAVSYPEKTCCCGRGDSGLEGLSRVLGPEGRQLGICPSQQK